MTTWRKMLFAHLTSLASVMWCLSRHDWKWIESDDIRRIYGIPTNDFTRVLDCPLTLMSAAVGGMLLGTAVEMSAALMTPVVFATLFGMCLSLIEWKLLITWFRASWTVRKELVEQRFDVKAEEDDDEDTEDADDAEEAEEESKAGFDIDDHESTEAEEDEVVVDLTRASSTPSSMPPLETPPKTPDSEAVRNLLPTFISTIVDPVSVPLAQ